MVAFHDNKNKSKPKDFLQEQVHKFTKDVLDFERRFSTAAIDQKLSVLTLIPESNVYQMDKENSSISEILCSVKSIMTSPSTGKGCILPREALSILEKGKAENANSDSFCERTLISETYVPPRLAVYAPASSPSKSLSPLELNADRRVKDIVLYCHQSEALTALWGRGNQLPNSDVSSRRPKAVVLQTSTSSGKSLVYQVSLI